MKILPLNQRPVTAVRKRGDRMLIPNRLRFIPPVPADPVDTGDDDDDDDQGENEQ